MYTGILVHPTLIDSKKCVASYCEANSWEVSSLSMQAETLASTRGCGGVNSGASVASNVGE